MPIGIMGMSINQTLRLLHFAGLRVVRSERDD